MKFTVQSQLGRFGHRWGCFFICLVNILEHIMGRQLRQFEVDACVGRVFRSENVMMANYFDHSATDKTFDGWGAKEDPEWHFLVTDMHAAMADLLDAFDAPGMKHKYAINEHSTQYGSHFIPQVDGHELSNPDPSVVVGALISVREVN